MARYCKFRGKAGVLVANPLALNHDPMRYAGQRRVVDAATIDRHSERYEPCDEVLPLDWHLEKAAQKGDGTIVARCEAKNMADARAKLDVAPAPAPARRTAPTAEESK